ncbi:MAG: hypothetical protein CMC70_07595 [Flavobacteriaceae bacterium]|nr:hypothetical protein [Flavobacteriaceae bacterium]
MQQLLISIIILTSITVTGQSQKMYPLKTSKSKIHWKGTYTFLMSEHNGTVNFHKGTLVTKEGNITGGNFEIDMTTISNPDFLEGKGPVNHLRDTDFFDVSRFPKAYLEITSVEYFTENNQHKILANLTIKGKTQPIEFWAVANTTMQQITTKFKIDRARWDITHNNSMRDHAISDAIEFDVLLQF